MVTLPILSQDKRCIQHQIFPSLDKYRHIAQIGGQSIYRRTLPRAHQQQSFIEGPGRSIAPIEGIHTPWAQTLALAKGQPTDTGGVENLQAKAQGLGVVRTYGLFPVFAQDFLPLDFTGLT